MDETTQQRIVLLCAELSELATTDEVESFIRSTLNHSGVPCD